MNKSSKQKAKQQSFNSSEAIQIDLERLFSVDVYEKQKCADKIRDTFASRKGSVRFTCLQDEDLRRFLKRSPANFNTAMEAIMQQTKKNSDAGRLSDREYTFHEKALQIIEESRFSFTMVLLNFNVTSKRNATFKVKINGN